MSQVSYKTSLSRLEDIALQLILLIVSVCPLFLSILVNAGSLIKRKRVSLYTSILSSARVFVAVGEGNMLQ